ncbi:hypothetical protein PTSG_09175 [Salpingoeca rosetta]|uniref:protein-tyrosine-phosphatase n=1 Tax=Salpingoeca rosetta (strain ATCC 50818 / BSB-021) TaxID=946362 RepID=F2UMY1_SALR5|nr:uncharacterized protein PTSG_09175 [Salpingoeca rosetta]EGD78480.1 hypothetical protein PTSG_09175 [Salpingoeca rosetta]|eukprot:XP_004989429.1 hypothetical protein PTSG_09175 [Salpingoeca rosetta]
MMTTGGVTNATTAANMTSTTTTTSTSSTTSSSSLPPPPPASFVIETITPAADGDFQRVHMSVSAPGYITAYPVLYIAADPWLNWALRHCSVSGDVVNCNETHAHDINAGIYNGTTKQFMNLMRDYYGTMLASVDIVLCKQGYIDCPYAPVRPRRARVCSHVWRGQCPAGTTYSGALEGPTVADANPDNCAHTTTTTTATTTTTTTSTTATNTTTVSAGSSASSVDENTLVLGVSIAFIFLVIAAFLFLAAANHRVAIVAQHNQRQHAIRYQARKRRKSMKAKPFARSLTTRTNRSRMADTERLLASEGLVTETPLPGSVHRPPEASTDNSLQLPLPSIVPIGGHTRSASHASSTMMAYTTANGSSIASGGGSSRGGVGVGGDVDVDGVGGDGDEGPPPPPPPRPNYTFKSGLFQSRWMDAATIHAYAQDDTQMNADYNSVPTNSIPPTQGVKMCDDKNRYLDILPNHHSRVLLSKIGDQETSTYINANWMPGMNDDREYIVTQGPIPQTVSDFWRMVWECDVRVIVMITRLAENGTPKCEKYWPGPGQRARAGDLIISHTSAQAGDFTTTTLAVLNTKVGRVQPMVVHCSAGIGRSGVFIGLDIMMQQARASHQVDPMGVLCHMRRARGGCVQKPSQWRWLVTAARDYLSATLALGRNGGGDVDDDDGEEA